MATNGIDKTDKKNLVEVKGYKKANKNLLKKVALGMGTILLALAIMCSLKCCDGRDLQKEPDVTEPPAITETQNPTKKPNTTNPGTTQKPGQNPDQKPGQDPNQKPSEDPNQKPTEQPAKEPTTPQEVIDSWTTGTIPDKDKVEVSDFDDLKEDSKLTAAEKTYIQEYVDYYNISWDDAKATYFAYGPLCLNVGPAGQEIAEPTYENVYVFDADDEAAIKALVTDLGMSRKEAEEYYVTVIAPALGKPIETVAVKLTK